MDPSVATVTMGGTIVRTKSFNKKSFRTELYLILGEHSSRNVTQRTSERSPFVNLLYSSTRLTPITANPNFPPKITCLSCSQISVLHNHNKNHNLAPLPSKQ